MLLYNISLEQRSNICVQFTIHFVSDPSLPWILEKIELSTKDSIIPEHKLSVEKHAGARPVFQLRFGDAEHCPTAVLDDPLHASCYHDHSYVPQWPWIVAQICLMENNGLWVATYRLRCLVSSVYSTPIECPFRAWLNKFTAPTDLNTYHSGWSISKYHQWQTKMSDVIFF
jgi:hypothetical protein